MTQILKGKGVYYRDADGVMHAMTFPPEDSEHEDISHFYINSLTGKVFPELGAHQLQFPMEKAAMIMAREIMEQGYTAEGGQKRKPQSEHAALSIAKSIMNRATARFNKIKRESGDDFHRLPLPFDESGQLHREYRANHYGAHQSRRVPTAQRQTRTEDGRLINLHHNNKAHPTLGIHLESHALHIASELKDEAQRLGIETSIGAKQNVIEPQQITEGVTRRYSSNERDPTSKENTVFPSHYREKANEQATFGEIGSLDLVALLPNDFFVPGTQGGRRARLVENQLMEAGVSAAQAEQMSRAPVNQLVHGRGSDGADTSVRKIMRNMREQLNIDEDEEIKSIYARNLTAATPMLQEGRNRGRNKAAVEVLAMLKTAEELGIDPRTLSQRQSASPQMMERWRQYAVAQGAKPLTMESLGRAFETHQMRSRFNESLDHAYDSFPAHLSGGDAGGVAPVDPVRPPEEPLTTTPEGTTQPPLSMETAQPVPPPYFPYALPPQDPSMFQLPPDDPSRFQLSDDDPMGVIATIMERVQLHDAGGAILRKYDPMDSHDMHRLGNRVGLTSTDVRAIAMSLGDWGIIAKQFKTTRDVVADVKTSCGGALHG